MNNLFVNVVKILKIELNRLNISSILRMFWAIRVVEQLLYLIIPDMEILNETLFSLVKNMLIKGCETFLAVLGMTSIISYIFHYIESFFQWVRCWTFISISRYF